MSHTVLEKGKLRKLDRLENETLEQQCARLLEHKELPSWADDYKELIKDEDEKFYLHNDTLYSFEEYESCDAEEFFVKFKDNGDGTYDFITQYYNGGCCLHEVLDDEFDKITNKNQ